MLYFALQSQNKQANSVRRNRVTETHRTNSLCTNSVPSLDGPPKTIGAPIGPKYQKHMVHKKTWYTKNMVHHKMMVQISNIHIGREIHVPKINP